MPSFELPMPPPPATLLAEDLIELRLLRVLGPADRDLREPVAQFIAPAPECRFAIHLRRTGERVGRIHLRLTDDPIILRAVGHAGYETEPTHRRRGYATRALQLIRELARHYAVAPIWILIAPDNVASRRVVERVGFTLYDIVPATPDALAMGLDPELCRYQLASP